MVASDGCYTLDHAGLPSAGKFSRTQGIIQPFKLEETCMMIKSKHQSSTAKATTKPGPSEPHHVC